MKLTPSRSTAALLLGAAIAALAALYRVRTYDTFFHLAAGRAIVEAGTRIPHDIFSFTARNEVWTNHSPGYQVLIYGVEHVFGFAGISVWQSLTALTLFVLTVLRVPRYQQAVAAAAALFPYVYFREVLEARPHVLGFVCLAAVLTLVLRAEPLFSRTRAVGVLGIYAMWTQAHGSHVLVFVILGAALLDAVRARDRAAALGWLGTLVTAFGLAWTLQPNAFAQGAQHFSSAFLEQNIGEWRPVSLAEIVGSGSGRVFALIWSVALLATIGLLRYARTSQQMFRQLALLLVFLALALTSMRMAALFLFGAGPLWMTVVANAWTQLLSAKVPSETTAPSAGGAHIHTLFAALPWLAFAFAIAHVVHPDEPYRIGVGLDGARFPSAAAQKLREPGAPGRVYNAYNFGGYLMWSRVPRDGVFVDGRAITVYSNDLLTRFDSAYTDFSVFEDLVHEYNVDGVLMPTQSLRVARLLQYLRSRSEWRLVHQDSTAVLFARRL